MMNQELKLSYRVPENIDDLWAKTTLVTAAICPSQAINTNVQSSQGF